MSIDSIFFKNPESMLVLCRESDRVKSSIYIHCHISIADIIKNRINSSFLIRYHFVIVIFRPTFINS